MPDLTREEVERRLDETAYDLGHPESWADMHMDACQCSRCGRWLQIVRPSKWQCECEGEPDEKYREREALQTAQSLYARNAELEERVRVAERERDDYYRQMMGKNSLAADLSQQLDAEVYKRQQAEHERDQLAAEGREWKQRWGEAANHTETCGVDAANWEELATALLAENRLLRSALKEWEWQTEEDHYHSSELGITYCPACGQLERDGHKDDCWMLRALAASHTTAEVERVKRLEAVAEAAESSHHALAMGENITPAFERLGHALAAWREGEAPNAHL